METLVHLWFVLNVPNWTHCLALFIDWLISVRVIHFLLLLSFNMLFNLFFVSLDIKLVLCVIGHFVFVCHLITFFVCHLLFCFVCHLLTCFVSHLLSCVVCYLLTCYVSHLLTRFVFNLRSRFRVSSAIFFRVSSNLFLCSGCANFFWSWHLFHLVSSEFRVICSI